MKQKFFSLLMGAVLVAGLFSCSDDDKKASSSVTIDGEKYAFEDGSYSSYEEGDGFYYSVTTYGLSGDQIANVHFGLVSETEGELPVGNYSLSASSETLSNFYVEVWDANTNIVAEYDEMKTGNVEVKKSGDTYTITFSFTFEDGEEEVTIKGTYKGTLEELS